MTLRECQSIYREWKYLVDAGKDTVCSKENKLDFAFLFCLLKTKHPSDYDFIFSYLVFKSKSDAIRKYRFADKNEYLPNQIKQAEKINSLSDPPYCPLDFHVDRFYYYRYQAPKEILKELLKDHKINDRLNLVEIN